MMKALVISDMHVASYSGLIPFPCRTEGMTIIGNSTQKALWESWIDMCKRERDIDFTIVNGDVCDGPQKKEQGRLVVTSDMYEQAKMAVELLSLIPCKKFYFTQGTEYHSVGDRPVEQLVADMLEKEHGRECIYGPELIINADWARIHVAHTINAYSANWMYRSTPIAKDLLIYELNKEEYGQIDFVIRSHAHFYVAVDFGHKTGIITPCWQSRTPYCLKKDIIAPPKIGYVVLEIQDDETHVIDIRKRFYKIALNIAEVDV